ncbi:hypothetical protein V6U80_05445 [Micromonospora sp. CPCC 205543]
MLVEGPVVRGEQLAVGDAGLVLAAGAGQGEQVAEGVLGAGCLGTQGEQALGVVRQPLGVGVAVLHDQPRDPLGVPLGEPEADRRSEVEDVHHEPPQSELLDEALGDVGEPVEGVGEAVRGLRVAEAGVVRSDQPVSGAEGVDEAAKLVRGRGKAVQEQQDRRVGALGERLAVEDADAVDVDVAVGGAADRGDGHL